MILDALRGWVVPTLSGFFAAASWLLAIAGFFDEGTAVVGIGAGLLVLILFSSFRAYFFAETPIERYLSAAIAVFWALLLLVLVDRHEFPGPALQAGILRPNGDSLSLPAEIRYTIVVDGHFATVERQGTREGQYALEVTPSGGSPQTIRGAFKDTWMQQRLGRRGTAPVEIQRTSSRHQVELPSAVASTLRLVETDASLAPELAVAVYTGTNPWLFPALGLLGVIGTLAFEKWADGDGSATLAVVAMAAVVYIYLDTPPHQPIRSLIGAILLGSILGVPVAMLLWRFIPRRWIARHA